jgi:hypothetical protein
MQGWTKLWGKVNQVDAAKDAAEFLRWVWLTFRYQTHQQLRVTHWFPWNWKTVCPMRNSWITVPASANCLTWCNGPGLRSWMQCESCHATCQEPQWPTWRTCIVLWSIASAQPCIVYCWSPMDNGIEFPHMNSLSWVNWTRIMLKILTRARV